MADFKRVLSHGFKARSHLNSSKENWQLINLEIIVHFIILIGRENIVEPAGLQITFQMMIMITTEKVQLITG
jgi:hypothetical protein